MLVWENQLTKEEKYLVSCGFPLRIAKKIIEIKRKYERYERGEL